jgi:hypothetical protein
VPACSSISGYDGVAVFRAVNDSFIVTNQTVAGNWPGLTALDQGNAMLAVKAGQLLASTDAGCSWTVVGTMPSGDYRLTTTGNQTAIAWGWSSNFYLQLVQLDGTVTQSVKLPNQLLGIVQNPVDAGEIIAIDDRGIAYTSDNGGESWIRIGGPVPILPGYTGGAITVGLVAPDDPNHIFYGQVQNGGAWVSIDQGQTWTNSIGICNTCDFVEIKTAAFGPAGTSVVWVMADVVPAGGSNEQSLFRSEDGGFSFVEIPGIDDGFTIQRGAPMAADPVDSDLVYFGRQGLCGFFLALYDHGLGTMRFTGTGAFGLVNEFIFSPASRNYIYMPVGRDPFC